jgi:hypothetical protein
MARRLPGSGVARGIIWSLWDLTGGEGKHLEAGHEKYQMEQFRKGASTKWKLKWGREVIAGYTNTLSLSGPKFKGLPPVEGNLPTMASLQPPKNLSRERWSWSLRRETYNSPLITSERRKMSVSTVSHHLSNNAAFCDRKYSEMILSIHVSYLKLRYTNWYGYAVSVQVAIRSYIFPSVLLF